MRIWTVMQNLQKVTLAHIFSISFDNDMVPEKLNINSKKFQPRLIQQIGCNWVLYRVSSSQTIKELTLATTVALSCLKIYI